jgi:hypothetical protein
MERCRLKVQLGSHIHTPKIVGKCEGMNPHTPKWVPTLRVGVSMHFQVFKKQLERPKLIVLKKYHTIGKLLKFRCLKWACMINFSIYNTSYGQNKGRKLKFQFDSQPLKIENRPCLHACKGHATYS